MKRTVKRVLLIIFTVLTVLSMFIIIYPYFEKEEGELTVHWSMPKGLKLENMKKGDSIEFTFSCDQNISVFLLKSVQAEKVRNPGFEQVELPEPLATGKKGSGEVEIGEEGDYELLFWNPSFRTDQDVHYSVKVNKPKNDMAMCLSGASLLVFSAGMLVYISISRKKE